MSMTGNIIGQKVIKFGESKTWAEVAANTTAEQTVNVPGIKTTDFLIITKPTHQAGLGYVATARCASDGVLTVKFTNPTASGITPTAEEAYSLLIIRSEQPKDTNGDF